MNNGKNINFCSNCGKAVQNEANIYCSHCGHKLDKVKEKIAKEQSITINNKSTESKNIVKKYKKDPILAAILTFILACLGQFYNGQILKGIIFVIILVILTYINGILAFLFLLYASYDAYKNAKYITDNDGNYFYNEGI